MVEADVREAAELAGATPFESRAFEVDGNNYLCCGSKHPRSLFIFGPYRRTTESGSSVPTLTEAQEQRAKPALALAVRAYSELKQARHQRDDLANQLELVGSAVIAVTEQLSLDTVLHRIVELARELAGARYAALGVPNERGEIETFIASGLTDDEERAIGAPPAGRGVLGALLREPKVIRMADLRKHPEWDGFPHNHPHMKSFLGVPIMTHGKVVGNLYLTEKRDGLAFSDDDAHLVEILARHAAVAIENGQLYQRVKLDRKRLQLLIDQLPEAVIVVDREPEQVTMANLETSRLLGWEIETPMPLADFLARNARFDLDGRLMPSLDIPLIRALRDGEIINRSQVNLQRADGKRITILVNGAPLLDGRGNVVAAVALFQDYTQIRDAEQIKDDFLSLVSHELRTPLTTIRGGAYMLLNNRNVLDRAAKDSLLADIERETERLQFIIENMVQLANIRSGRYALETEPIHIRLLIERAVNVARETAPNRTFDITTEPDLLAEADETSVEQVLMNLLRNAIKYTPSESPVEVSAHRCDDMIEIAVRDHGPGISDEDLPFVFDRFRRGSESQRSRIEGMGIGLYLAKNLVEAHGGSIIAERPADGGTRIRFTISALNDD
jgi:PAS domain S-box-containing protein